MFKPTADNYEAITRARDYLVQTMDEYVKAANPQLGYNYISTQFNEAIDCIDEILAFFDERSE